MTRGLGGLRQAAPEEIDAKEGDRPAVIVLLIDGPLRAEVINKDGPISGQNAEREDQHFERVEV